MPDGAVTNARTRIAAATRAAHERLHTHPVLSQLGRPTLSRTAYRSLLRRYAGFFAVVEERRAALGAWPGLHLRAQVAALTRDAGGVEFRTSPVQNAIDAALDSPSACLGALYVLHGANFGNRTLAPAVRAALPDEAHAYFSLSPCAGVWRALCAALDAEACDPAAEIRIIEGANAVFSLFYDHASLPHAE